MSSGGSWSRPAIRSSMVEYGPRCSPWLTAVSVDVVITGLGNGVSGVFWSFFYLLRRICDGGITGGGGGVISPGGAVDGGALESAFLALEVVAYGLIATVYIFSFELPPAL